MAYRRYRPRRFKRKRAPWYRRKYNAVQLAGKALSGVKYLKGLVNSERLSVITSGSNGFDWAGSVAHLTAVAQGDTVSGRTGNSIFVRSLLLRGVLFENSANLVGTCARLIVFIDNQQVADTSPSCADLLESTSTVYAPFTPLDTNTQGRFKILYNKVFTINLNDKENRPFYIFKNMRHHVRYNGTASSDVQKGGIYLAVIADRATNLPSITWNAKVSYHDN